MHPMEDKSGERVGHSSSRTWYVLKNFFNVAILHSPIEDLLWIDLEDRGGQRSFSFQKCIGIVECSDNRTKRVQEWHPMEPCIITQGKRSERPCLMQKVMQSVSTRPDG
ncbi:hypothetical protein CEXT_748311 [Caerostris extrusa]|uniref:Uncharacterized protein n=1 Tax=Caerostris extrusa TaxID=172846 RepID=A0AAV4X9B3_CAEEX|nr:hypothetical protein CEXT_748311 [Caerostris extrusa]